MGDIANNECSWEVIPPEGKRALGGPAPLASVRIVNNMGDVETVRVPTSVGRALIKKKKEESFIVTRAQVIEAIDAAMLSCAHTRVANLLVRREYSSKEVIDKLCSDGYAYKLSYRVVQDASQSGLINDARFADTFIRSKLYAGWGMQRIERELRQKGIEARELEGWPYEYLDPEDEITRALEVAERKRVKEPHAYQKLVRFLVGRGFGFGVAKQAAARVLEQRQEDL